MEGTNFSTNILNLVTGARVLNLDGTKPLSPRFKVSVASALISAAVQ
eukprot:SAG31_NODE_18_length_35375_cov_22.525315_12_plen_47_part_00